MFLMSAPLPGGGAESHVPSPWNLVRAPLPRPPRSVAPRTRLAQPPQSGSAVNATPTWPPPANAPASSLSFDHGELPTSLQGSGEDDVDSSSARHALWARAGEILDAGWEASTRKTYERAFRLHVHGTEQTTSIDLLPVDSTDKLMILFAAMDRMSWSVIRINKQAVRAWHQAHGFSSIFDAVWDERTLHFWRGL